GGAVQECPLDVQRGQHPLAANADDHVARLEPGIGGRAGGVDPVNGHAADGRAAVRLDLVGELQPVGDAVALADAEHVPGDSNHRVHGNREGDVLGPG